MRWLFGKKTNEADELKAAAAVEIWMRYAAVLEQCSDPINDINSLPFSKDTLENALPMALARAPSTELREMLGACHVALSSFQSLSPVERAAMRLEERAMLDAPTASSDEMNGIALTIAETGKVLNPVRSRIAEEATARKQQFDRMVEGLLENG